MMYWCYRVGKIVTGDYCNNTCQSTLRTPKGLECKSEREVY